MLLYDDDKVLSVVQTECCMHIYLVMQLIVIKNFSLVYINKVCTLSLRRKGLVHYLYEQLVSK